MFVRGGTKIACGIVTLNGTDAPNVQSVKEFLPTQKRVAGSCHRSAKQLGRAQNRAERAGPYHFLALGISSGVVDLARATSLINRAYARAGAEPLLVLRLPVRLPSVQRS